MGGSNLILLILVILTYPNLSHLSQWSKFPDVEVLYVLPITSILRRLALVPVGDTGTIPFTMHKETKDFSGASCDSKKGSGDGNRWWYINSTAMKWATSQ
jgi:hypothetical protein